MAKHYPGCRKIIGKAYKEQGIAEDAIPTLIASLSVNTLKQYDCTYKKWWSFCSQNSINWLNPTINNVLSFLNQENGNGASYNTLNCHKSALKVIINFDDGEKVLNRFLKGIFRENPVFPRYEVTWDPQVVLDFLATLYPLEDISLELLTYKIIMHISLVSSHRV